MSRVNDWKKTLDEGMDLAREGIAFVAEKAEDASRIAALRLKIFGLQRRMERYYAELGQIAFESLDPRKNLWDDPAAQRIAKEITALQTRVNDLFAQIQTVGRRGPTRRRSAPEPQPRPAANAKSSSRRRKPDAP